MNAFETTVAVERRLYRGRVYEIEDWTGRTFGKLTVVSFFARIGEGKRRQSVWLCRCECGAERRATASSLSAGMKSCGCADGKRKRHRIKTPEYAVWSGIRNRCVVQSNRHYRHYGGRGISMCERWLLSFDAFLADMGPRPSSEHQIDRIDNDGNYEPGNCRWATRSVNCRNKRSNIRLTFQGMTYCVVEWSEILGINPHIIYERIREGWTPDEALALADVSRGTHKKRKATMAAGEINEFERTSKSLKENGWHVHASVTKEGWECRMECGVDVLPAATPRPRGCGITAMAALTEAVRARDKLLAGVKVA